MSEETAMKINTEDLSGAALDWVVSALQGEGFATDEFCRFRQSFCYSSDWLKAGPIIERAGIGLLKNSRLRFPDDEKRWMASWIANLDESPILRMGCKALGPTPLVAAMRVYVVGRLGRVVDVPEVLVRDVGT
jgi:hypothetical protein